LKTYGQSVFLSTELSHWYDGKLNDQVLMQHTYISALESLLGQYASDINLKSLIAKRTTALKIQSVSDKTFIKLFKLKTEAMEYRHAELEVLNELQDLNSTIIYKGGEAIDLSGYKIPQNYNSNISQTNYNMASGYVATGATVLAAALNAADKAFVTKCQAGSREIGEGFQKYVDLEKKAVDEYNQLISSSKVTEVNQTGNHGYNISKSANNMNYKTNLTAPSTNIDNFWDESKPDNNRNIGTKQTSAASYDNTSVKTPVYHIMQSGETLGDLSMQYGVAIDDLKKWNNLSNGFNTGQPLVVGYTKSQTANTSANISGNKTNPSTTTPGTSGQTSSNTDLSNFWDSNQSSSDKSSAVNNNNSTTNLKPLTTSADLKDQLNNINQSINQNADNAKSNLQQATNSSFNWSQGYTSNMAAPPVTQAITKGSAAGGTDLSIDCPEGVKILNQMTERCGQYVSIQNGNHYYEATICEAEVTQDAINACRGKASPYEIEQLQKAVTLLKKQADGYK
jgi:LysM repeat protein